MFLLLGDYEEVFEGRRVCNLTPPFEDFFEDFCEGKVLYGPFFQHVIGFWNASLKRPSKVLFLQYKDFKEDPTTHLNAIWKSTF